MTDETKKLFDAPWKAVNDGKTTWDNSVQTSSGYMIACGCFSAESKRLARLPELYDALAETIEEHCDLCINFTGDKPKLFIEEILKFGCPAKSKTCHCIKKIELLRKVMVGE